MHFVRGVRSDNANIFVGNRECCIDVLILGLDVLEKAYALKEVFGG